MLDLVNRIYLHCQCSAYCYKETHRRGAAHTHTVLRAHAPLVKQVPALGAATVVVWRR